MFIDFDGWPLTVEVIEQVKCSKRSSACSASPSGGRGRSFKSSHTAHSFSHKTNDPKTDLITAHLVAFYILTTADFCNQRGI